MEHVLVRRVVALPACGCSPAHLWLQAEHGNVEEADKMFTAFAAQQKLKQESFTLASASP